MVEFLVIMILGLRIDFFINWIEVYFMYNVYLYINCLILFKVIFMY